MGSRLFVWGGLGASAVELDNGAIYDPATDGWTTINSADAPTARLLATAVWTGSVVVVWGGGGGGSVSYASGGVYDPALDRWTPMRTAGAPSARRAAHGIWTGSRVLFWGGFDAQGAAVDSAAYLYDPVNDTWSSVNEGEPTARTGSATGFSGLEWLVYGGATGSTSTTETFRFAPLTGDWTARAAGPSKRRDAFSTWDGAALFVWGGQTAGSAQTLLADGSRYLPGSDAWSGVPAVGAPSARAASHRETGWAAAIATGRTLIVGGYSGKLPLSSAEIQRDGAIYDAASGTWLAVPAWPSGEARLWAAAGWTGTEFVLSGGLNGSAPSNTGERIRP
jgi:N-acetylneuraminic acid mutarotase